MNPWNGASSSILPCSEEAIGGRHDFPGTSTIDPVALAGADVCNERIETLPTAMLDDAGMRLPGTRRIDLTQGAERDGLEISETVLKQLSA